MAAMLDDAPHAGEPVAGLVRAVSTTWFGSATPRRCWVTSTRPVGLGSALDLILLSSDEATILPELFDRCVGAEPGNPAGTRRVGGLPGRPALAAPRRQAGSSWRCASRGTCATGRTTPTSCAPSTRRWLSRSFGVRPRRRGGPLAVRFRPRPGRGRQGQAASGRRAAALATRRPPPAQGRRGSRPAVPARPRRRHGAREPGLPARPGAARSSTSAVRRPARRGAAGVRLPARRRLAGRPVGERWRAAGCPPTWPSAASDAHRPVRRVRLARP